MVLVDRQVKNSNIPPKNANITRTVIIEARCPEGESMCSDGVTCSESGVCSNLFNMRSFDEPEEPKNAPPSLKLIGESFINIKQVRLMLTAVLLPHCHGDWQCRAAVYVAEAAAGLDGAGAALQGLQTWPGAIEQW